MGGGDGLWGRAGWGRGGHKVSRATGAHLPQLLALLLQLLQGPLADLLLLLEREDVAVEAGREDGDMR